MANLEAIIAEKSQQDNQWRAEMQADRENTIAMQDAGVEEITSSPELYVKYLDMQGDNPTYSAGNIALVMFQDPEATVFGTAERWKTLNRGVIDQERSKGVKIFARNTLGRGYRLTDAYDIRQTQGRDLKKVQLKDDSKEMSIALRAILNYSVVPVATDHDLPVAAYYDSKNMELAVNPAFSDSEAFAAIAAEVAHSRIHAKGPTQTMTMRRWTWTPRAFPISCAASLASSGTRQTCPAWRSCTRAGIPSSGGAPWIRSRG
ncbi:MAG: hypothetical protein ACLR0P_07145 [Oscillospiraceae bacterium]